MRKRSENKIQNAFWVYSRTLRPTGKSWDCVISRDYSNSKNMIGWPSWPVSSIIHLVEIISSGER